MFFLFVDGNLSFIKLIPELEQLIKQLLPLGGKGSQLLLGIIKVFEIVATVNHSKLLDGYFLRR